MAPVLLQLWMEQEMKKRTPKILDVDDDPDFIDAISKVLKSAEFEVASLTSPKQVENRIFDERPDLIILDLMMDGLFDGFDLCNEIRSSDLYKEFSETPVIFISAVKELTGSRFDINIEVNGSRGPDAYLDKPVNPKELIAVIESLLQE